MGFAHNQLWRSDPWPQNSNVITVGYPINGQLKHKLIWFGYGAVSNTEGLGLLQTPHGVLVLVLGNAADGIGDTR